MGLYYGEGFLFGELIFGKSFVPVKANLATEKLLRLSAVYFNEKME